jgi:hypothetical protein
MRFPPDSFHKTESKDFWLGRKIAQSLCGLLVSALVIPLSHWSYVNEDLAASMKKGQSVVGTPRTF